AEAERDRWDALHVGGGERAVPGLEPRGELDAVELVEVDGVEPEGHDDSVTERRAAVTCRPGPTIPTVTDQRSDNHDLGRVGLWTFALDQQPATRARELAAEIEELGYGALWIPDAVNRDPMVNSYLLLSGTRRLKVATGIANIYGRDAMAMTAGWKTVSE